MYIDYQSLLNNAMIGIVKKILTVIQYEGIQNDDQSFYISFRTDEPGVVLSERIRNKYPKEITIVLQYQFKDLQVFHDKFSVNISFNQIFELIEVPFSALINFVDPVANFTLQFNKRTDDFDFKEVEHKEFIKYLDSIDSITIKSNNFKNIKSKKTKLLIKDDTKSGKILDFSKAKKCDKKE